MMLLISLATTLILVALFAWVVNTRNSMPANIKAIVNVVLGLIVVGIALWLINTYVPMAGVIKAILNIVVVIATCVGVLQALGLWTQTVSLWSNLTHRVPH
jgi:predicted membrane protein